MLTRTRFRACLVPVGLALGLLAAVACTTNKPPPIVAIGDPVIGINPQIPTTPGARTKAIKYGPWTVPAATGTGHHGAGMVEDVRFAIERPCTDCYITAARPDLKYTDGTVANTDTGLWLHHFAMGNSGGTDARCSKTPLIQLGGELLFTAANERTAGRFPAGVGHRTRPLDFWTLGVDLMNTSTTAKDVVLEMTWEWVPATTPGMVHAKGVYLDTGEVCVNSVFPAQEGKYSRKNTWTVDLPGRVLGAGGHMHDGGTHVTIKNLTTGELICESKMHYGGPGFEEPEPPGGHDHGASAHPTVHISGVDQCAARAVDRPIAVVKRGDVIEVEAFYDQELHPHPLDEMLMGTGLIYVVPE
jgi:hypothetical protein